MKTTVSLREGSEATDKAISYYHTDHLGSSSVITDEKGNQISKTEYQPYGTIAHQEGTDVTNYKFTGKELDSTGLYYYGARYYDPELGRFTQADTIVQSPYDPQSLNRYSYCRNNPINYTDPTGHSWKSFWKKAGDFFSDIGKGIAQNPWTFVTTAVAAVLSFGILAMLTPMIMTANTAFVIGSSAAMTQATLDTQGGQQLINFISNEIMDDAFGMRPQTARTWGTIFTYMVVNATYQSAFGAMMTGGEKVTSKNYSHGKDKALDVEVQKVLDPGKGKGFNYGGVPKTTDQVSRVLFNKGGDLVGVASKSNILMLGAQHTGVIMSDIPSLTGRVGLRGIPGVDMYGLWGISHQAVNVSLLEAGYSSTVMSVGGGWTTVLSTVVYGPYGGGVAGAAAAIQELGK